MDDVCPIDCAHTPEQKRRILRRIKYERENGPIDYSDPMTRAYGHPEDHR